MSLAVTRQVRKMLGALALAFAMLVSFASPAHALSCAAGKVVWIKSNTTINAGHGWLGGTYYNFWPSGGWHTTVTNLQSSGFTWIDTDGVMYSGSIYCSFPPN